MKLGSENRTKTIVAGLLMALALIAVVNALWGGFFSSSSSAAPASAAAPATTTTTSSRRGGKKVAAPRSLDPTLRYDWLKASEDKKYEGNSRNIFRAEVEIPKPVAPVAPEQPQISQPTGPPPPPPITLKFFGFANKAGEPKRIFLSQGEDVFIAREGDIVDRRYRVVRISPTSVEIEDVLNNNRQSIPLTQG